MTVAPLGVSRPISVEAVNRAFAGDRLVLLLLQKSDVDEPTTDDLERVGTVAVIRQMSKGPGGLRVIVEGVARAPGEFLQSEGGIIKALIKSLPELSERSIEIEAHVRRLQDSSIAPCRWPPAFRRTSRRSSSASTIRSESFTCSPSLLDMKPEDKQKLLEENNLSVKLDAVSMALSREIEVLEVKGRIESKAEKEMTDAQREYLLRQQMKAIQSELGEGDSEAEESAQRVEEARLPEQVATVALREVDRLERMTPASPEYQMIRTYLEWVLDIPWDKPTEDRLDPVAARKVLDEDHYDLDKVKERIVEYLAVRKLKGDMKGPILCFVGPPGVGKTSLGQSIARAMNRKFMRISLGGVRDEAEIRGHRRTYIGSMPGRIAQALKTAGVIEPRPDARRDRQDLGRRPGRSCGGAARGARPGPESLVPRPLPRDPHGPVTGPVHRDGESARHDPPGVARSHGDDPAQRLHRGRESSHRQDVPHPASARGARPEPRAHRDHRRCTSTGDRRIHARGGRPLARAADRHAGPKGRRQGRHRLALTGL